MPRSRPNAQKLLETHQLPSERLARSAETGWRRSRSRRPWFRSRADCRPPCSGWRAPSRGSRRSGTWRRRGVPVFHEAAAPSTDELEAVLLKIIMRTMRLLTRLGALIEEPDRTYPAEIETDGALRSLQAASCTYRIALGPRAGQKVLSLQSLPSAARPSVPRAACQRARL